MGCRKTQLDKLQSDLNDLTNSLFQQGVLDEQFAMLKQLQDDANPDFVAEVVALYFNDSPRILDDLTAALSQDPVDFKVVDDHVHQFKGSSASIGAGRVKNVCTTFRRFCDTKDPDGCRRSLDQVKEEYFLVKRKLEQLFELERQLNQAST